MTLCALYIIIIWVRICRDFADDAWHPDDDNNNTCRPITSATSFADGRVRNTHVTTAPDFEKTILTALGAVHCYKYNVL